MLRQLRFAAMLFAVAVNATISFAQTEVSHIIIGPEVQIQTAPLTELLPPLLRGASANISKTVEQQIRVMAGNLQFPGSPVHVFGNESFLFLAPGEFLDGHVQDDGGHGFMPIVRINLKPVGPSGIDAPMTLVKNNSFYNLQSLIAAGNYSQAVQSLNHIFDGEISGFAWSAAFHLDDAPVVVGRLSASRRKDFASGTIYHQNGWVLERDPEAKEEDFRDLYVIRNTPIKPAEVSSYGQVLNYVPDQFIVLKLNPDRQALVGVKRTLQQKGIPGGLIQLTGDPVSLRSGNGRLAAPSVPLDQTQAEIGDAVKAVTPNNIHSTVDELSAIFTRYHDSETGKGVAAQLAKHYEALRNGRSDVQIELVNHKRTPQPSLVVRIIGKKNPDEIIVLGSHIDSINQNDPSDRAPGSDDNASGTAVNLEIFRIMMERGWRPDRTIEIHGYAAEEIGLVGSQEIASQYKREGKKVVSMVQFDMNLYKKDPNGSDKIWFVTNESDAPLIRALGGLIESYVGVPWGQATLLGGDSDQTSWRSQGFLAALATENPKAYNHNIHTPKDTTDGMFFNQSGAFAKLGLAYLGHFGGFASSAQPQAKVSPVRLDVSSLN